MTSGWSCREGWGYWEERLEAFSERARVWRAFYTLPVTVDLIQRAVDITEGFGHGVAWLLWIEGIVLPLPFLFSSGGWLWQGISVC